MALGPLHRLRQWLRPLPAVGWVARARLVRGRQAQTPPGAGLAGGGAEVGVQRDVYLPGFLGDADAARAEARSIAERALGAGAEIVRMRAADRRDIPPRWRGPRLGPPRHFGFVRPRLTGRG